MTDFGVLLTKACYVLTETCYYCLVQQSRWHEFILMFAVYLHILHIGILIYHGLCTIFVYFISQNVGSPWFPRIPVRKVDDLGGWTFSTFITCLSLVNLIVQIFVLLLLTGTVDVLLWNLWFYGGVTNQDVLLSEMCYCSRLYGI